MRAQIGSVATVLVLALCGAAQAQERAPRVSAVEYEGWRQYSVQCARCHGQDVTGNPVAANLLESARSGGPVEAKEEFTKVVADGRLSKGMPAFKAIMKPEQIDAVYAYVKGRADGRIAVGRPAAPAK
jgi:polar amino acid transport system substrate-binding protein